MMADFLDFFGAKSTLIKFGLIVIDDGEGSAKNNGFLGKNYTSSGILQGFGGLRMEDNLRYRYQLNATAMNPTCSSIYSNSCLRLFWVGVITIQKRRNASSWWL